MSSAGVCSNSNAAAGSLRACTKSLQRGTARCIALHCDVLRLGIDVCCLLAQGRAAAPAAAVAAVAAEAVVDYRIQTLANDDDAYDSQK